jgi:hypothetical protein
MWKPMAAEIFVAAHASNRRRRWWDILHDFPSAR